MRYYKFNALRSLFCFVNPGVILRCLSEHQTKDILSGQNAFQRSYMGERPSISCLWLKGNLKVLYRQKTFSRSSLYGNNLLQVDLILQVFYGLDFFMINIYQIARIAQKDLTFFQKKKKYFFIDIRAYFAHLFFKFYNFIYFALPNRDSFTTKQDFEH